MHECGMPIRNLREEEFSLIDGRALMGPQTKIIEIEGQSKSPLKNCVVTSSHGRACDPASYRACPTGYANGKQNDRKGAEADRQLFLAQDGLVQPERMTASGQSNCTV